MLYTVLFVGQAFSRHISSPAGNFTWFTVPQMAKLLGVSVSRKCKADVLRHH